MRAAFDDRDVWVDNLSFVHGDPTPLDRLDDDGLASHLEQIRAEGYERLGVARGGFADLAATAVAKASASVDEVDAMLLAAPGATIDVTTRLESLGVDAIGTAVVAQVAGNDCADLAIATMQAAALASRQPSTVLVVGGGASTGPTRLMAGGHSALDDGAAAWTVSSCLGTGRLQLLAAAARGVRPSESESLTTVARAVRAVTHDAIDLAGLSADTVRSVVLGNYGASVRSFLGLASGLRSARAWPETIDERGHTFGADVVANLRELPSEPGQSIVALANGIQGHAALVFRVGPSPA